MVVSYVFWNDRGLCLVGWARMLGVKGGTAGWEDGYAWCGAVTREGKKPRRGGGVCRVLEKLGW